MDGSGVMLGRLQSLRSLVELHLDALLPDPGVHGHRVRAAMRYAVLTPGKRLRPTIALLTADHLGCSLERALPGALALELVHAASLVLDDLPCMDDAAERRGQPSVHVRFGEDVAVLTGVALLNEAYDLIGRSHGLSEQVRLGMSGLISRTVGPSGLIGGQDKDLLGGDLSASAASQLHHEKTGVLFLAAVEMGALAADAGESAILALRTFARELGLAFQALDDLSDAEDVTGGKPSFNMISIVGSEGLKAEAKDRLSRAKAALCDGPPPLAAMGGYVDLLLGRRAA